MFDDEVKWYRRARARRTTESSAWEKVTAEFFKLYDRLHHLALEETSTGRFSPCSAGGSPALHGRAARNTL